MIGNYESKIWCEVTEAEVTEGKCLYDKGLMQPVNVTCPKCDYYLSIQQALKKNQDIRAPKEEKIKKEHPKTLKAKSGKKKAIRHFQNTNKIVGRLLASDSYHKEESTHLKQIKQAIPVILNLHSSFWENPKFLQWQLIRLNKKYRDGVDAYWKEYWPWDSGYIQDSEVKNTHYYEWIAANLRDPKYLYEDILSSYKDFFPNAGERYLDWRNRLSRFNDEFLYGIVGMLILGINLVWLIDRHNFGKTLPLPWTIRFPCPMFLFEIPDSSKARKKKGRPRNWGFSLLVYELSQAGMKDMEIARLLFGVHKSTKNYSEKESALVRIYTIKNTIGTAVSQAYQEIERKNISPSMYRFSPEKSNTPIALRYNRLYWKTVHTLPPIEI